ncbi:hypothetical protein ACP70R_049302 [Stipagrostis hirtigluma subsp. patula]
MTLIDVINLSSDDEILKDHKAYAKGHAVCQGIDIVDFSSDNETTREDHYACKQGYGAQMQHQGPLYDREEVSLSESEGRQRALESGNLAKTPASFLVTENENLCAATAQNFPHSSTTGLCPSQDNRLTAQTAASSSSPASPSPKARTVEASAKPWKSPRLDAKHKEGLHKSVIDMAVKLKSSRVLCQQSTSGRRRRKNSSVTSQQNNKLPSPSPKAQTLEASTKPWKSPRLDTKHKNLHKSVLDMAVKLKSSRMLFQESTSGRRRRKNASATNQQNNKLLSPTAQTSSASRHGCSLFIHNPLSEADVVAAQAEEVDPAGSVFATV